MFFLKELVVFFLNAAATLFRFIQHCMNCIFLHFVLQTDLSSLRLRKQKAGIDR